MQPWVFHEMGLDRIALVRATSPPEIGAPLMDEIEERRHVVLRNLATHAAPARGRLRLSLDNAARLARLAPEVIAAIENGSGCTTSLAVLTQLALFLGLSELGVPRSRPAGMQ